MKNIKLLLVLFYGVCYAQLKVEPTNFEKIAVGGRAEYNKVFKLEVKQLIFINGIEVRKKDFDKVDPADIEKFDVLKDEMAVEKYGTRATDGVIMITTKKNKFRKYKKLLKYNATTEVTIAKPIYDKNQYNIVLQGVINDYLNKGISKAVVTNLSKKEVYYSDSLGNYKINISKNDLINFSKQGFESQKIRVKTDTTANIILKVQTTPDVIMVKKPVIYLYPKEKTDISINIDFNGKLLTTFPKYDGIWTVTAYPNGRIFDKKTNRFYSSLFWDGSQNFSDEHYNYQSGFVVSKNNLSSFLIEKLEYIGLSNLETNEFVQYWLPILEKNETNFIHFYVNSEYDVISKNTIIPKPDTEIRLFMDFYGLDKPIEIPEQKLQKTERKGFTVVEWGGSDVTEPVNEINRLKL